MLKMFPAVRPVLSEVYGVKRFRSTGLFNRTPGHATAVRGSARFIQFAIVGVGFLWMKSPTGNGVVPAGSSQRGKGGNTTVGAFDVKGAPGEPANYLAIQ